LVGVGSFVGAGVCAALGAAARTTIAATHNNALTNFLIGKILHTPTACFSVFLQNFYKKLK
jgi:hypothetical protein